MDLSNPTTPTDNSDTKEPSKIVNEMDIYGEYIPDKILTHFDLLDYVKKLNIPNFRGVL